MEGGFYKLRTQISASTAVDMMSDTSRVHRVGLMNVPEGLQLESKKGIDGKTTPGIFEMIADATKVDINGAPVPIAFFAVVSIGVVGLYLCFAVPIFLRWRMGDSFEVGSWNLRGHHRWMAPVAVIEIVVTSIIAMFPTSLGGVPWDPSFEWKYVNYAPILLFGRRVRALSRQSQDRVADVGSYVGEVLGQIKTVQAYNHQDEDKRRFGESAEAAFDVARKRIGLSMKLDAAPARRDGPRDNRFESAGRGQRAQGARQEAPVNTAMAGAFARLQGLRK